MSWYIATEDGLVRKFDETPVTEQTKREAFNTITAWTQDGRKRPVFRRLAEGVYEHVYARAGSCFYVFAESKLREFNPEWHSRLFGTS